MRYVLFADDWLGRGWNSYKRGFATLPEAEEYVSDCYSKPTKYWWQIVDLETREIVKESE